MTSTRTALLASILANPQEDTPRLVYADFLEERGEVDRAEFVRDCIILQQWTDCPNRLADLQTRRPVPLRCGVCEYCLARRRAERYYAKHQWMDCPYAVAFEPTPLDGAMPTGPGLTLIVRRGFISSITISWDDWLRHHEMLYWSPGQTVECKWCDGGREDFCKWSPTCTGLRPRPLTDDLAATCQPLEMVTFSDHSGWNSFREFTRENCPTCGGENHGRGYVTQCPTCFGTPPNRWLCDAWPGLVFVMPNEERIDHRLTHTVTAQGDMIANPHFRGGRNG